MIVYLYHIGVNITIIAQEIMLFERHLAFPAFQLKCPAFCVFRNDRVTYLFVLFIVLSVWNLKLSTRAPT